MVTGYISIRYKEGIPVSSGTTFRRDKIFSTEVLDLLNQIKSTIDQVRSLPVDPVRGRALDNPETARAGAAAVHRLGAFLNDHRKLVLATGPSGLLINGRRLGAKDFPTVTLESSLVSLFMDAGIRNIAFRLGVTQGELLSFLDGLLRRFWDLKDPKAMNLRLAEQGVRSIGVDDNEQEPLSAPGSDGEAKDASDRLPGLLSLEKGRDGIAELYRLFQAAPGELRPGLRKVAAVILDSFRHDARLAASIRRFVSAEAPGLMPDAAEGDGVGTVGAVAQAESLLLLSTDEQTEPLVQQAAPLVHKLLAASRGDLAAKILARLAGVLLDSSPEGRRAAAEALLSLHPAWDAEPFSTTREGFETLLRSALDDEEDSQTYSKMAEVAAILADGRLTRGEPELALETLSLLRRHHASKNPGTAFRPEVASRTLEQITRSAGFPPILERLRSGDPLALRVVESLGEAAAKCLVDELKKIEMGSNRLPLAEAISRIGPGASAMLSDELQKASSPIEALRLLEALPHAAAEETAIVALSSTLHHRVGEVRRRSAAILTERAYARSGELLLQALPGEKEPTTRATIVEGLGRLRVSGAFEGLATIADSRSESDDLRAAACAALAALGHKEAIPILSSIASKTSRGLGLLKSASPALRTAAIRALGQFQSTPEAREAIKRVLDESDATLKAVAMESLSKNPTPSPAASSARPTPAHATPAGGVKLAGSLQEIAFDQVCQLVGGSEKTGLLVLSFDGRVARIWFERGLVVAAEYERRRDQEAFNAIARHRKGDFHFQPSERPPEKRIQSPVHMMLLEAFRLADEGKK
jgi:hypothetical protein